MKTLDVVMVSKDNLTDFSKSLQSLKRIVGLDFRVILIDSSENQNIKNYAESQTTDFSIEYHWQEPQGIYAAMNFALDFVSQNNLIWFLNPGDVLVAEDTLIELIKLIEKDGSLWGFAQAFYENSNSVFFPTASLNSTRLILGLDGLSHQAMLVTGHVLRSYGGFDRRFIVAADLNLQTRLLREQTFSCIYKPLVAIDVNGLSHKFLLRTYWESFLVRMESNEISIIMAFRVSVILASKRLMKSAGKFWNRFK
jgi:GT2 family glycosyltransferase